MVHLHCRKHFNQFLSSLKLDEEVAAALQIELETHRNKAVYIARDFLIDKLIMNNIYRRGRS